MVDFLSADKDQIVEHECEPAPPHLNVLELLEPACQALHETPANTKALVSVPLPGGMSLKSRQHLIKIITQIEQIAQQLIGQLRLHRDPFPALAFDTRTNLLAASGSR